MHFCADQRLRRQLDFQRIRTEGRRFDCGSFVLQHVRREPEHAVEPARLGVVASIAAVGNAIQRARAKRRLREVFRRHQELVPPGHDLLLVARRALNRLEFRELERKFTDACRHVFPPAP